MVDTRAAADGNAGAYCDDMGCKRGETVEMVAGCTVYPYAHCKVVPQAGRAIHDAHSSRERPPRRKEREDLLRKARPTWAKTTKVFLAVSLSQLDTPLHVGWKYSNE